MRYVTDSEMIGLEKCHIYIYIYIYIYVCVCVYVHIYMCVCTLLIRNGNILSYLECSTLHNTTANSALHWCNKKVWKMGVLDIPVICL